MMATTDYKRRDQEMKVGDVVRVKMAFNTFVEGVLIEHWPENSGWLVEIFKDGTSSIGGFGYDEISLVKTIKA